MGHRDYGLEMMLMAKNESREVDPPRLVLKTAIAWGLFGVRLGHRDGLEKMVMGKKFRCDQTKLVLTSARAGAPKRGTRARALI